MYLLCRVKLLPHLAIRVKGSLLIKAHYYVRDVCGMFVVLLVVGCGGGAYAYTRQLLALDCKRPVRAERMLSAVPGWSDIASPMAARVWEAALASHPDIEYRSYLVFRMVSGLASGTGRLSAPVQAPICSRLR